MKILNETEQLNEEVLELLENSDNKSEAILQAINKIQEAKLTEKINELKEEQERAESDKQYAEKLGLRILNKEEKEFYQKLKNYAKQEVTFKQDDVIPTTIINRVLDDIQKTSKLMEIINIAPPDVQKWIAGSYTGVASWHGLTEELKGKLEASLDDFNVDVADLDAYLVIPKALSDLGLPFVDKFFNEILTEALILGMEEGALVGNGKNEPIGLYKQINKSTDGVHQDKEVHTDLTSFKPKALAGAKKFLTKDGKRVIDKIYVVCNPNDEADYVAPAIYDDRGNLISSYKNIEVITSAKNPQGKAALVLPKKYTMGFSGFKVRKYDQTLALKNADVLIGNVYANGRADDDNVAYIFDVTKLEEYIPTVKVIGNVSP